MIPIPRFIQQRLQRVQYPVAFLVALLQRTPVLRMAGQAEEALGSSPIAAWIRSGVLALGTVGAADAMAGASVLITSSPKGGTTGTAGSSFPGAVFSLTPTEYAAESWTISSGLPPGLALDGNTTSSSSASLTFNTSAAALKNPGGAIALTGTPTAAGTYVLNLTAYEYPNGASNSNNKGNSATLQYTLTINGSSGGTPPAFTIQPTSQETVAAGGTAAFTVAASGSPAPTYQWYLAGSAIAGATDPVLFVANVGAANAGVYTCVATNSAGSATSGTGTLTVASSGGPGYLANLSSRGYVGNGGSTNLVVGFYTTGSSSKQILLRGVGPTLGSFGITDALQAPYLTFFNVSGATLATNATWGGTAALQSAFNAVGAFSLPTTSADTALLQTEPAGGYTAQVSGQNGSVGVALAEIYDDSMNLAPGSRLINISSRALVLTGSDILVDGFIVTGSNAETVLVRAVGPTLATYGVTGPLAQPVLTVYQINGSTSTVIASNTGWGGDATLSTVFNRVGAFSLPSNSSDAAMVITLAPGTYTAQVTGVNSTTGVALAEVYEVR